MTRYLKFVVPALILAVVLVIMMINLSSALVYFNTPTEVAERSASEERLRLGGRVVPGSVVVGDGTVSFDVEDCDASIAAVHTGVPPQLFQEGIGVVLEGVWTGAAFESDTMLVKHDEQYRSDYDDYDEAEHACSIS